MDIFLDMDGVIADFVGGVLRQYGIGAVELEAGNGDDIFDQLDLDPKEFWSGLGDNFFATLELYPHSKDLVAELENRTDNLMVLSSPSRSPSSAKGKMMWLTKHFPNIISDQRHKLLF